MSRSIVGSGANLASFSLMKEYLMERQWKDNAFLDMVCGLSSGVVSCIFMNPIDVVRTRYYNQPYTNGKGALYCSGYDAIQKIWSIEGPQAFYKGFVTHFLRIGPHFCRILGLSSHFCLFGHAKEINSRCLQLFGQKRFVSDT
jgi:solute carrier family 25 protein 34/35